MPHVEFELKGTNVLTLFLDFDGVLHPEFAHSSRHFCCLPYFEAAVRQLPSCSIVISSTWRLQQSVDSLRLHFSPDVGVLIEGATPKLGKLDVVPDRLLGYEREAECETWLRSHARSHLPWLAVDDRSWLFRPFNQSLFLVNGATGLTTKDVEALVARARAATSS